MADRLGSLAAADTLDSPVHFASGAGFLRGVRGQPWQLRAIGVQRLQRSTTRQTFRGKELGVLVSSGQVVISPVRHYPRHKMLQHSSALQLLEAACVRSRSSWPLPSSLPSLTGCGDRDGPPQSQASAEKPAVVPKRILSVADFYKNTEYSGASWAPGNQKLLVSSNVSGIWNAYSMPRRRRAAAADEVHDEFDLRYLVLSCRRTPAVFERRGRQRAHAHLRPEHRRDDEGPDAGREAEGELQRLGGRRQVVLRVDERA